MHFLPFVHALRSKRLREVEILERVEAGIVLSGTEVKSVRAGSNIEMPFRHHRARVLPGAVASGELPASIVEARVVETLATLLRFAHVYERKPGPEVVASANPGCSMHLAAVLDLPVRHPVDIVAEALGVAGR